MSVARPAHSLLGRCLASTRSRTRAPAIQCHQFHSSAPRSKRRSRFRNVKAEEMGLLNPSTLAKYRQEKFPEYSKEDHAALKAKYTPEQLEALKAGEEAVNPDDMIIQGRLRDDPYRPNYVEDYTVLDPRYDLKPDLEATPREPQWLNHNDWVDNYGAKMTRLTDKKTSDQLTRAMIRALRRVKESNGQELIDLTEDEFNDLEKDPELLKRYLVEEDGPEPDANASGPDLLTRAQAMKLDEAVDAEWKKELDKLAALSDVSDVEPTNLELIEDGPAGISRAHSAEAAELGKVPGVEGLYKSAVDPEDEGQDDAGHYQEIKRLTGMTLKEIQSIYRKVLVTRWVSNQTRLGKVRSTSVVAIAGNGNGRLGLGIAKSTEAGLAAETAQLLAIRNMKPIRRYENRTIYGNAKAKVSGTVVELFSRPPGMSVLHHLGDSSIREWLTGVCSAGFGLRCPHRIFEMCRASGLHDIAARMPRSKNPMNSVKAAYDALMNQADPEEIAIGRGKKMVDVRKVYYGGAVY
ncbi:37S ribosomal protein S5, mitochondrial [Tolypocladium paradoxum]|uniref:Small ribosomal subunit protein uS5m n=1 Tax=Tolypocladium paradoxum TaxID=94208 RepID=A0A2S4KQ57_9HYPO|nr:37S ribosomal protein S5, mitochondrial [Tolypocladium paradoxum]